VHVRDIAHADSEQQRADVEEVLSALGALKDGGEEGGTPMIEALNKIDALEPAQRAILATRAAAGRERATQFPVSALTGEGIDALLAAIEERLGGDAEAREVTVPLSDGATLAWLYRHGEVRSRHDEGDTARLTVALDAAASAQFDRRQMSRGSGRPH
ncbi:MAG: GTPase HflX, partial [Alphaproteobacteria bacterium]|nr:GTPase HflX [Alphaproteobacteria bacterium]